MSKYVFSESFGNFTDKDTEDTVLNKYRKNVIDHILRHYEIHVNSHDRKKLTSHQLLYYHVYGDYRLVLDKDKKPTFVYKTSDKTEESLLLGAPIGAYYLNSFLDTEKTGIINGIYANVAADGALKYKIEEIAWMNKELELRGAGTRFNLPSIGTEVVKMHAYGNATDDIKKGVVDELRALSDFFASDSRRTYPAIYGMDASDHDITMRMVNGIAEPRIQIANFNEDVSRSIIIFIQSLFTNKEYEELYGGKDSSLVDRTRVKAVLSEIYDASNEYNTDRAIAKLAEVLFKGTGKFASGTTVMFSDNFINAGDKMDQLSDMLGETDSEEIANALYKIYGFTDTGGYILESIDLFGGSPQIIDTSFEDFQIRDNDLIKTASPEFDSETDSGDVRSKGKGGSGKVVIEPVLIVYQRILVDTLAAIQVLCQVSEWAKQSNDENGAKTEVKMRFLSQGVNTIPSKKGDNKNKANASQVRPIDVYDSFPNIAHFDRERLVNLPPSTKSNTKLGNTGLLDELTKWRAFYTLSILTKVRKKTYNKQAMDDFYSSNILLKEIAWMATALSDSAKVLGRKEEQKDLMAQIQYTYVRGVQTGLQQTAVAPKETVFYEVDVPLLKEVIMTYTDVYNKSVIYRAFNTPVNRKDKTTVTGTDDVKALVTEAYEANKADNKDLKNKKLGEAMALQPKAFKVDQPFGWDSETKKAKTKDDPSPYPGITYIPETRRYHVAKGRIPRNIEGAKKIPGYPDALAAEATGEPLTYDTTVRTIREPAKEGNLAKLIWQSVETRTTGIFDLEGARPHEFMLQLFAKMDDTLGKSQLVKAPYPDAWFGTNIVEKLTSDPMKLGEAVETRYYEEMLKEYISALKTRYMDNYLIPSVLLTQTQMGRIKYNKNPEKLKMAFMERLEQDSKKPQLVTTNYVHRPYSITVAIMRGVLQIPSLARSEFVAKEIDEDMRTDIRKHMALNRIAPILPRDHPMYVPFAEPEKEPEPPVNQIEQLRDAISGGVRDGVMSAADELRRGPVEARPVEARPMGARLIEDTGRLSVGGLREPEQRLLSAPLPEEPIEEIPAPPEMRVDQLDTNWDEINPVIPEPDDIEEFEEVSDNPKGVYDKQWMYYDKEHIPVDGQLRIKMDDGEIVQYKFHIALDPSDYLKRTRNIVSTFLNRNKIYYKCGGTRNASSYSSPTSSQYGKMFTLYVENQKEAITVVKGMQVLSQRYNLKGLVFQPTDDSNMSYERAIPGTNNTLYYTVEKASSGAVIRASLKAGLVEIIEGKYMEMTNGGTKGRRPSRGIIKYLEREKQGMKYLIGKVKPKKLVYLGPGNYYFRPVVMDYYWGQGPIDAYLERGTSP